MGETPADSGPQRVEVANLLLGLRRLGVTDQKIVAAFESVPRDVFVRAEDRAVAYTERALPIACGQTISAPNVVGMMTAALEPGDRDKVLEVGTGSGYQAAILARLVRRVYTVERFRTLLDAAESRFQTLGISNVTTRHGDGALGWPEQAPFDAIMVTAAADAVPDALFEQVRVGGIVVAPVGPVDGVQRLVRYRRTDDGLDERFLADVRFVPLISGTADRL